MLEGKGDSLYTLAQIEHMHNKQYKKLYKKPYKKPYKFEDINKQR